MTYYRSDHPDSIENDSYDVWVFETLLSFCKGNYIFVDRYYTPIALFAYLCEIGFYFIGTLDTMRKNFLPSWRHWRRTIRRNLFFSSLVLQLIVFVWFLETRKPRNLVHLSPRNKYCGYGSKWREGMMKKPAIINS